MIDYQKFTLENGLKIIVHIDKQSPFINFNILYNVGSKNEERDKTGYAHLLEHLMFSGTPNIPNFDEVIEEAGGDSNAFTNSDITNYYINLPKSNIEIAFWVEADRMNNLGITQKSLEVQKKVVIEEYHETSSNSPYGKAWYYITDMVFEKHPYNWPTICKKPIHIEDAQLKDIQDFYSNHYTPDNATICISGNTTLEEVKLLSKKYFNGIKKKKTKYKQIIVEPEKTKSKRKTIEADIPLNALFINFLMVDRLHPDFPAMDFLSDLLADGKSSILFQNLVKEKEIFNNITSYVTGTTDKGIFSIEGKVNNGVKIEDAEKSIWEEIEKLIQGEFSDYQIKKGINKVKSSILIEELSLHSKSSNLAYYEYLGKLEYINTEIELYEKLNKKSLVRAAKLLFREENCCTLEYRKNQ